MAKPYKRKGSRFYWIAPWIDGKQSPRSSQETDYDRADRKLKILEGKLAANAPITARTDRGTFAELLELVRTDYKIKKQSVYDLNWRIDKAIAPVLGHLPAGKAWQELEAYILGRQTGDDAVRNATINRELAIVKRAYRLGERKGLVSFMPAIEMLPEGPERDGYFSRADFAAVVSHANELTRSIMTVAYITGWRLRSILKLQWIQVDLNEGFVWQTEVKNEKATRWPLDVMNLRAIFEGQKKGSLFVFHRKGKPVKSIRKSFENALEAAGLSGVFHDFRGTAIVNLLEAGVDTPTIMNMVGLKSQQMVIRYARRRGMRDDRLREAGKLLELRLKGSATKAGTT